MPGADKAFVAVTVGADMQSSVRWQSGFRSPRFSSHQPLRPLSPSPDA